jgi:hypothetical protein
MDLATLYEQVKIRINTVNFEWLWKDFKPTSFALYNDNECFLNGHYIEKPSHFMANTSIKYEGEFIAIWNVTSIPNNLDQFAASIIHEMFHAFQNMNQETRYADENNALIRYSYHIENLSLKLQEAELFQSIIEGNNLPLWSKLVSIRAYRHEKFPYEYEYESSIEQIEGSAHYVELKALEQLDYDLAQKQWKLLFENVCNPKHYFPIRIISYSIGALVLRCINKASNIDPFSFSNQTFSMEIIQGQSLGEIDVVIDPKVLYFLDEYQIETKTIINQTLKKNEIVLVGKYPLVSLNIYNARYIENYATSTYFVAYNDGTEMKVVHGDFVVQLDNEQNIIKIYRQ